MRILFKNEQWAVTDHGLESATQCIKLNPIPAAQFLKTEIYCKLDYYAWPLHMAKHSMAKPGTFEQAFRMALELHKDKLPQAINAYRLDRSFDAAERLRTTFPKPPKNGNTVSFEAHMHRITGRMRQNQKKQA